jgi:5-methylcytosine-specific restriction endonuclease McrA
MSMPCVICGANSLNGHCFRHKPRKFIQAKKPMRKRGKHFKQWIETRDNWLEQNKAPYYFCYICDKMMTRTELTLDHIESRSRRPELRYVLKNLRPCCAKCNSDKGSLGLEEYLEKLKAKGGRS